MTAALPEHLTIANTVARGIRVRVFLDGAEQRNVEEAHTGEGWLVRHKLDAEGRICVEGDSIVRERLSGAVTAEVME